MANPEHLAILKQGVKVWNEWRDKNPDISPDLSETDLSRMDFTGADLAWCNLCEVDLYRTVLVEANFWNADVRNATLRLANLAEADLSGAKITGSDLREAVLFKSNLAEAKLNGANLTGADLTEADLTNAVLNQANLRRANLSKAILVSTDLTNATLVETNLSSARLEGCLVYGISAWNIDTEGAQQVNLVITRDDESAVTLDNLKVAQFIYLILNNREIRDVINTITTKVVLILGRFTSQRKVILDTIREELRKHNYLPVLFDFDKPATRDITETVRTLAHLSRFIIADISDPSSIPMELQAVVPDLAVPVQPLLVSGQREFSMFVDFRKRYHWVLATHQYTNIADLLSSFDAEVIAPAEAKAKELEKR